MKAGECVDGPDSFKNYIRDFGAWWVGQSDGQSGIHAPDERLCHLRKVNELKERGAAVEKTIVRVGNQQIKEKREDQIIDYQLHIQWLIRQHTSLYLEEKIESRQAVLRKGQLVSDNRKKGRIPEKRAEPIVLADRPADLFRGGRSYNRRAAVRYAELWWDQRNPVYPQIENDCTNFVSQCLHAGTVAMWGRPVRSRGWWQERSNWSFSWAVANSLRWYLSRSGNVIGATERERADQLVPGDVICYDFDGDGHWNHNTIVTSLDASGQPLVNAHTYNTRNRYWTYTDSPAWTPKISYKFFHIEDDV